MALEQNDIIEIQVIGDMQGQPIFNVFHFIRESLGAVPADAETIANAWLAKFNDVWLDMHTAGYAQQAVRVQRIVLGSTGVGSRLPPASATSVLVGTRVGENNPACQHIWASYITEVAEPNLWFQGGTALAAGAEEDITDGSIGPAIRVVIDIWADLMKEAWTPLPSDDVLRWAIFSKVRFLAATPPIALMLDSITIRNNVSASEKRRKGTSRGGFQPGG